jgi:hydroxyacylglutathione hydrolase
MDPIRAINLGFVNAYLLEAGEGWVLIDAGVPQQWAQLDAQLAQAGVTPENLRLVVVTHGDFDHIGCCAALKKKYHVKIAMHPADAGMARTGVAAKRRSRRLLGRLFLWFSGFVRGSFPTFEPDVRLRDGQDLAKYGLAAKVIHTPGHTKGSIAVLTASGALFPGDTVGNQGRPDSALYIENDQELRQSIALLKGLGARVVYPGHGSPFGPEELAAIKD